MTNSEDYPKAKDSWDKLAVIGSPLIAIAGLIFTYTYNAKQDEQKALQTKQLQAQQQFESVRRAESDKQHAEFEKSQLKLQSLETFQRVFYPELVSSDPKRREVAQQAIQSANDGELLAEYAALRPKIDALLSHAAPAPAAEQIPATATAPPGHATRSGWAYLGDYDATSQTWKTRYLEFPATALPASLTTTTQRVDSRTGALNVRAGMPTQQGSFPNVIDVLRSGSTVKIIAVRPWLESSYQWAQVEYSEPAK